LTNASNFDGDGPSDVAVRRPSMGLVLAAEL
jgi:hypothetical protein